MILKYVFFVFCFSSYSSSKKILLSPDYSPEELPPVKEGPLLVSASINLRNILDISETKQQISLETTLRFYWQDTRVTPKSEHLHGEDSLGQYVNLHPRAAATLWMPDTFIDQAISLRKPAYYTQTASIRVYNDSSIRYSARMNYDVACAMDFHKFPLDQQVCSVKFESFSYSSSQIQLKWRNESDSQVNSAIHLDQFMFNVDLHDNYQTIGYDITYPGLIMKITLTRVLSYHLIQTYIPSSLFVILGWLSLFIPQSSVPGRVGMGMTTILTLTAMFNGVRQNVPRVSYVSYLDIWMVMSVIFVNCCMFEFVVVTFMTKLGREKLSNRTEERCRVVFPLVFIIFNLFYWPIVCHL